MGLEIRDWGLEIGDWRLRVMPRLSKHLSAEASFCAAYEPEDCDRYTQHSTLNTPHPFPLPTLTLAANQHCGSDFARCAVLR